MSLSVECHHCGQRYKVSDTAAGKKIECPKCHTLLEVPSQSVLDDDLMPPSPGRSGTGSKSSVTGGSGSKSGVGSSSSKSGVAGGSASKSGVGSSPSKSGVIGGSASKSGPIASPGKSGVVGGASPAPSVAARPAAPVAQPIAPVAQPVVAAAPVAAPIGQAPAAQPAASAQDTASFDSVRADAVAEMLDEQEHADRDHFRGLRRKLRNPPSLQEIGKFMLDHKMATVVAVLSLFFVAEYLRSGQLMFAAVFGIMAAGLICMGTHEQFSAGTLFQASAFCYLIVLCAFPFVLKNREQLGLFGRKMLENPKMVAQQPNAGPSALPSAPEPGADDGVTATPDPDTPDTTNPATVPDPTPLNPANPAAPAPNAARPDPDQPRAAPSVTPQSPDESPMPVPTPDAGLAPSPSLVGPAERSPRGPVDLTDAEALRERADTAFSEGDSAGGMQYLYAEAIAHSDSDVWNAFRWNRALGRPVIGVRWGVATALDDLASQLTKITIGDHPAAAKGMSEFQKAAATAFARQTQTMGGDVAVRWFRQCFDDGKFGDPDLIRAPSERALRGVTYLGADTPAEAQRAARSQQLDFLLLFDLHGVQSAGQRGAVAATIRVIDVAGRRELHASKPRTQPALVRRDLENTLEAIAKEVSLEPMPDELDTAAIEARFKALSGKKVDNPLPLVAELDWYAREKRLPQGKIEQYMSGLVGPDAAKALASPSAAERAAALARWLPKRTL